VTPARPVPPGAAGWVLAGVLAASLVLRIALVLSGGQNYWPDEVRYGRSRQAVEAARLGDFASARRALSQPDHLLFGVLGLLPASLERLAGPDPRIPALFFALFSVASVLLVSAVMRRAGETAWSSCLGALLLAAAATDFYYARHLLPYDAALTLGLSSLYVGLRSPASALRSMSCGLLSCAAFLTYNGYWLLAALALFVHVLSGPSDWRSRGRRALAALGGFAAPLVAIVAADGAAGGHLAGDWAAFSRTASQGRFAEGWSLPFAYLWHAEHAMTLLWAASFVFASWRLARGDRAKAFVIGVAGIAVVYGGLVLMSVGLEKMVVYGRQARQLVPFACILTAAALDRLWIPAPGRRLLAATIVAGVLAQAALNFREPLTQVFPAEFRRLAEHERPAGGAPTLLLFAEHIYPIPAPVPAEAGAVLLARRHPLQFLPYQYEGYTPEERAALRSADIRMRLVLAVPAPGGRVMAK